MEHKKTQSEITHASLKAYIIGFILSVALTLLAFYLVYIHVSSAHEVFSHPFLLYTTFGLAFIQLCVQLFFFLHLGRESKPHWNLIFFMATVGIILIVVGGSIWIMIHLNYNMTPTQVTNYMIKEEGIHH